MARGHCEAVLDLPQKLRNAAAIAETEDGLLVARFASCRDAMAEAAFEAIVRRHGPMVLRVCQQILGDRHRAEDAFQATFLLLARRAGSIRQPDRLANWLHGVALRTAREARTRDERRRRREALANRPAVIAAATAAHAARPEHELARREALEVLHEEVSRLPERYRGPVVLCELEGLTQQEAAQRLHCPLGTVGVRLMRARQRLRSRLIHRGLAPTAGLLGALLCADEAAARIACPLLDSTVRTAMAFSAGSAAAGVVSAPVVLLTNAVLRTMALARLQAAAGIATAVAVALFLWASAHRELPVVTARQMVAPPRPASAAPAPSAPTAPSREPARPRPENSAVPAATPEQPRPLLAAAQAPAAEAAPRKAPAPERREPVALARLDARPPAVLAAEREVSRGSILFGREWVAGDAGRLGGDGLGPLYNDTSCVACHGLGAPGGAGPESKNVVLVAVSPNSCGPTGSLDRLFPGQPRGARSAVLHRYATDPEYSSWRAGLLAAGSSPQSKPDQIANEDPVARRIRLARLRTTPAARNAALAADGSNMNASRLTVVQRNTPPLFGLGPIDAIPSDVLIALAEKQPAEVRGRVGRTKEGRVGRFGWKAQIPSLHEFVRVACANELGLEVPGHSQAVSPVSPGSKPHGLDLSESDCDALVAYVRALPAPVVVDPDGPQGNRDMREGRRLFEEIGCATCHVPSLGEVHGIYSDLLLHNLGQSLADPGSSYGIDGPDTPQSPSPGEWRTPPLWGYRDSGPYLHDGRAQDLDETVALHEGQAAASARQFFAVSSRERSQVETFLKSLVAPSAAAAPGMMLAAELETRIIKEREPEERLRRERDEAVAREQEAWREARRREREEQALKRVRGKLPQARALEKMGRTSAAIKYYREIVRDAPDTEEGRQAADRIQRLRLRTEVLGPGA